MNYCSYVWPGLLLLGGSAPSRCPGPQQESSRALFVLSDEVECLMDLVQFVDRGSESHASDWVLRIEIQYSIRFQTLWVTPAGLVAPGPPA